MVRCRVVFVGGRGATVQGGGGASDSQESSPSAWFGGCSPVGGSSEDFFPKQPGRSSAVTTSRSKARLAWRGLPVPTCAGRILMMLPRCSSLFPVRFALQGAGYRAGGRGARGTGPRSRG